MRNLTFWSNVCLFAADVLENGLVDIPDSPGQKEDPLASLKPIIHRPDETADPLASEQLNRESSPEFLGFSESVQQKSIHTRTCFTPWPVNSTAVSPREALLRVSQPRTSKSKASLVWKKDVKYFETAIKEEPKDDFINPTKATKKPEKIVENIFSNKKKIIIEKNKNIKYVQNGTIKQKTVSKKVKGGTTTKKIRIDKIKQEPKSIASDRNDLKQNNSTGKILSASTKNTSTLKKYVLTKNKHLKIKRKKTSFNCETCGRTYKYLRGLRQHKKLECNVEPQFPCPYCPSRFRYRQNIREHVRNYHEAAFPKWYATHYVMPVFDSIDS